MSAMDRPTDHDCWPRVFIIPKALRGTEVRKYFDNSSALREPLAVAPVYLSNKGLVELDPAAISGCTPELLITATARQAQKGRAQSRAR